MPAKYAIGIDLGTTNSVLAYASMSEERAAVHVLPIPQMVAPASVEPRASLPSFGYLPLPNEATSDSFALPWGNRSDLIVGEHARRNAAEVPDRTVVAAKSWLCHSRVDRHKPILPWNAPASVAKISPVMASRRYLEHLVAAWNHAHPDAPFAEQEVVLTVPASFDVSARELTREAALAAGLPERLVLLEEPQAALYAWLADRGDTWRKTLKVGSLILVCDLGGGTTDLTLVSVAEEEGELVLRRVAVGEHLLVGGDNMDLAMAHYAAGLFEQKGLKLDPWQSVSLWHSCRMAKETLLGAKAPKKHPLSVLGRGSKLIGGAVKIEVEQEAIAKLLMDGFFPDATIDAKPEKRRASGFQEIGLAYEQDPAITRHLAAFLNQHLSAHESSSTTFVLFNGGVFKSEVFRTRLLSQLTAWRPKSAPKALDASPDLDHSVAKGAAFYGWTKSRGGVRIRGGVARSYYVGIETSGLAIPGAPRPLKALCVVPFGMEEGTETEVPSTEVGVVVGEPAKFRFFSSPSRKNDQPGDVLSSWSADEIVESDSLETTLPPGEGLEEFSQAPVRFQSKITELGVLELSCVSDLTRGKWKLEFSVRSDAEG